MKFKVVLVLLGILVSVALTEILLRTFKLVNPFPQLTQESKIYGWDHIPNKTIMNRSKEFNVEVKINSFGSRGENVTIGKAENTKRVAIVGDSFVEGIQVEETESVRNVLEVLLNKELNETFEVLNFSVGGYGLDQKYLYIKNKVLEFKPDYIFLFFANNDLDDIKRNSITKTNGDSLEFLEFEVDGSLKKVIKSILKQSYLINFIYKNIPTARLYGTYSAEIPLEYKSYLGKHDKEMEDKINLSKKIILQSEVMSIKNNTKLVLVLGVDKIQVDKNLQESLKAKYQTENFTIDYLSNTFESLAKDSEIPVINLLPIFLETYNENQSLFYNVDGHWNQEGHKKVAQFLFHFLSGEEQSDSKEYESN